MNDGYFMALMGALVLGFLGFLGAISYSDHVQKMECMKQQAMWVRGTCIFPNQKQ
jgi:hypothetical protein